MVFNIFYTSQYCTDYQYSYDFDSEAYLRFDLHNNCIRIINSIPYRDSLYNTTGSTYNYLTDEIRL
jgi:hypothetical protein